MAPSCRFSSPIQEVQRVVHRDLRLSPEALVMLDGMMQQIFNGLVDKSAENATSVDARSVDKAVSRMMPAAVANHAKSEGDKALVQHANGLIVFKIPKVTKERKEVRRASTLKYRKKAPTGKQYRKTSPQKREKPSRKSASRPSKKRRGPRKTRTLDKKIEGRPVVVRALRKKRFGVSKKRIMPKGLVDAPKILIRTKSVRRELKAKPKKTTGRRIFAKVSRRRRVARSLRGVKSGKVVKRRRVIRSKIPIIKKVIAKAAETKRPPRIRSSRRKGSARTTPKPKRSGRKLKQAPIKVGKSMKGWKRPSKKVAKRFKSAKTKVPKKSLPKRQAKAALSFKTGVQSIKNVLHPNLELSTDAYTFISEMAKHTYKTIADDLDKDKEINAESAEMSVTRALPTGLVEHAKSEGQRNVILHAIGFHKLKVPQVATKAKGREKPAEVEASKNETGALESNEIATSKPKAEFPRSQKEIELFTAEKVKPVVKTKRGRWAAGKPEQRKRKRSKSAKKSGRPLRSHRIVKRRKISGKRPQRSPPAKRKASRRSRSPKSDKSSPKKGQVGEKPKIFDFRRAIKTLIPCYHSNISIEKKPSIFINELLEAICARIIDEAITFSLKNKLKRLSSMQILEAVRKFFPEILAEFALSEGTKALL